MNRVEAQRSGYSSSLLVMLQSSPTHAVIADSFPDPSLEHVLVPQYLFSLIFKKEVIPMLERLWGRSLEHRRRKAEQQLDAIDNYRRSLSPPRHRNSDVTTG